MFSRLLCTNIPIKRQLEFSGNYYVLINDVQKLRKSAAKLCNLCKLILESIEDLNSHDMTEISIAIVPQFLTVEIKRIAQCQLPCAETVQRSK